ncbi:MAG: hypothetical protein JW803_00770 [Endomicrobiales bacterium]|nr:hypothetical protein [Endomicrobiales bacterium]
MNYCDWLFIGLIAVFGALGYETGIITSLIWILSGFSGMWAAQDLSGRIGVNFYAAFFAASAAVIVGGFILSRMVKIVIPRLIDGIVGAGLGLILGLTVVGLVIIPFSSGWHAGLRKGIVKSYAAKKMVPELKKIFPRVKDFDIKGLKDEADFPPVPEEVTEKVKGLKKAVKR